MNLASRFINKWTIQEAGQMALLKENSCLTTEVSAPQLPLTGFVRLPGILAPNGPIPISKSSWWQGIKDGRYPKPVKLGPRITAWRVEDIRALISEGPRW